MASLHLNKIGSPVNLLNTKTIYMWYENAHKKGSLYMTSTHVSSFQSSWNLRLRFYLKFYTTIICGLLLTLTLTTANFGHQGIINFKRYLYTYHWHVIICEEGVITFTLKKFKGNHEKSLSIIVRWDKMKW